MRWAGQKVNATEIKLSEVIGALSYALDITEGQPQGHAARSCMIGMKLADVIGLSDASRSALFYALLMKDLGCSSNAAKVCYLFSADDRQAKRALKTTNWTRFISSARYAAKTVAPHGSMSRRLIQFAKVALAGQKHAKELVQVRCDRGAQIARMLEFPDASAIAIRSLDEHWDGAGHPDGLRGDQIPQLSRILNLAQTVEVFVREQSIDAAYDVATERCGTWFEPALVDALWAFRNDVKFWTGFINAGQAGRSSTEIVAALEPEQRVIYADEDRLDRIAGAFAQVIDAKSPWTYRHSTGVAEITVGLAGVLGLSPFQSRMLKRAALVHDLGKLGVSNLILDKPGKLTPEELVEMRKHACYTHDILQHVAGFRELADLASAHHERLDGKGYHRGMNAERLGLGERVLAVADMYEALSAKRPYRTDLTNDEVMNILTRHEGTGICPIVFDALKTFVGRGTYQPYQFPQAA